MQGMQKEHRNECTNPDSESCCCLWSSPTLFDQRGFGEKARISSLEKLKLQEIFSEAASYQLCLCHRGPAAVFIVHLTSHGPMEISIV